jgi:hypothetical protein
LFRDPLAERLAGEQGRAIVAKTPMTSRNGWWLVARTKIIDDAIARAIEANEQEDGGPAAERAVRFCAGERVGLFRGYGVAGA